MDLKRIEIKCYKSLIDQEIIVSDRCMVFVGLNESGKTNLLNSIRMLDGDILPIISDKSKINDDLPCVTFHFDISGNKAVSEYLDKYLNSEDYENVTQTIKKGSLKLSNDVSVTKALQSGGDVKEYIDVNIDLELNDNVEYMYVDEETNVPEGTMVQVDDETVSIEPNLILEKEKILEPVFEYFTDLTKDDVIDFLYEDISSSVKHVIPSVFYWEYSSKYLIPSEIPYDDFIETNNPYSISEPLYHIFLLPDDLGIDDSDDLREQIKVWRTDSSKRRKDSRIINDCVNKYIKSIWKEYDQNIEVNLETDKITIHVRDPKSPDNNYYEMVERSQGFKTFVSFLLTAAAESRMGMIENCILILDEPETHLHPSGIKFMRNELLKISELGNNVFFATHSIFMIDRKNLRRHIILDKQGERSYLKKVERNNITQESVIYEALGTRVDEFSIKNFNIMFEGELDRRLFEFYSDKCIAKVDNVLSKYELLDGGGTKNITTCFKNKVVPKESEWRFILDNDKPAKQLVEFLRNEFDVSAGASNVKIIINHYSNTNDYELEDILPSDFIARIYNVAIKEELPESVTEFNISEGRAVSSQFKEYVNNNSLDKQTEKLIEQKFKEMLDSEVSNFLDQTAKKKTIPERAALFREKFPQLAEFINKYYSEYIA